MKTPKAQTVELVPMSEIVPDEWKSWFHGWFNEGAPFSWGNNNRTLVDPIRFGHHAEDVLDNEESFSSEHTGRNGSIKGRKKFFSVLNQLAENGVYIDLEN